MNLFSVIEKYLLQDWDKKLIYLKYHKISLLLIFYSIFLAAVYYYLIWNGIGITDLKESYNFVCIATTILLGIIMVYGLPDKEDRAVYEIVTRPPRFIFFCPKEEIECAKDVIDDSTIELSDFLFFESNEKEVKKLLTYVDSLKETSVDLCFFCSKDYSNILKDGIKGSKLNPSDFLYFESIETTIQTTIETTNETTNNTTIETTIATSNETINETTIETLIQKLEKWPNKTQDYLFFGSTKQEVELLKERSENSAVVFNKLWLWTIGIMLFYYAPKTLFLGLRGYGLDVNVNPLVVEIIMDSVNILSSYTFFLAFLLIAIPTYSINRAKTVLLKPIAIAVGIFVVFLIGLDIVVEFVIDQATKQELKIVTSLLIGLFSSLVMALFVGRLDSKFTQVPGVVIGLLYIYAISLFLMPLLGFHFDDSITLKDYSAFINSMVFWLFHLAFVFKLILALTLIWLFQSYRFVFYIIRMNILKDELADNDTLIYARYLNNKGVPRFRDLLPKKK